MKFETVLNAMMYARDRISGVYQTQRNRQYWRFRDWLVRRDARMEGKISMLKSERDFWKAEAMQEDEE